MKPILLVEDNDDIREAVAELLRDSGYAVSEAENGLCALDRLREMDEDPCLLLLDLMMPVMSGVELLHVLHKNQRLGSVPVIVVSAGGSSADVPEANKFLHKPVDPEALLRMVDELCRDGAHGKD